MYVIFQYVSKARPRRQLTCGMVLGIGYMFPFATQNGFFEIEANFYFEPAPESLDCGLVWAWKNNIWGKSMSVDVAGGCVCASINPSSQLAIYEQ
jgi:hypothetical protein